MDPKEINEALRADGWAMAYETTDPGGYDRESRFMVTLNRKGQSYRFKYMKGSGHRRWKKILTRISYWTRWFRQGQQVPQMLPRLKKDSPQNVNALRQFAEYSEPIPPTLDETLWASLMDANMVRFGQTFKEFTEDLGYSDDSIKAKEAYNACKDAWSGLVRLGANFEQLDELFQDY